MTVEVGFCNLCGQEMVLAEGDCYHPYSVARACPPEPGPMMETRENWEAWQKFYADGLRPLRPGREHFVPSPHLNDRGPYWSCPSCGQRPGFHTAWCLGGPSYREPS